MHRALTAGVGRSNRLFRSCPKAPIMLGYPPSSAASRVDHDSDPKIAGESITAPHVV